MTLLKIILVISVIVGGILVLRYALQVSDTLRYTCINQLVDEQVRQAHNSDYVPVDLNRCN